MDEVLREEKQHRKRDLHRPETARWLAIGGMMISLFIVASSWMVMRFPEIEAIIVFESADYFDYVVAAFFIGEAMVTVPAGKLFDIIGERKMTVLGASVYIFGTVACACAPNGMWLTVFRLIQGIGGGFIFATAVSSVGTLFNRGERGRPQGFLTAAFAFGSFFGTAIGYYFVMNWTFRGGFLVLALGVLAGSLISFYYLPSRTRRKAGKTDYMGFFLISVITLAGGAYVTLVDHVFRVFSSTSYFLLFIIFIAAVALYYREKQAEDPVIPTTFHPLQYKIILALFFIGLCVLGILQFYVKIFLFYYGESVYRSCFYLSFIIVGGALPSMIGCRKVTHVGVRPFVLLGCMITIFALLFSLVFANHGVHYLWVGLILLGTGLGCIVTELLCCTQDMTHKRDMGAASASAMGLRLIGIGAGMFIYNKVVMYDVIHYMDKLLPSDVPMPEDIYELILDILLYIPEELGEFLEAFVRYFQHSLIIGIAMCLVGILIGVKMGYYDKDLILDPELEDGFENTVIPDAFTSSRAKE